MKAKTLVVTIFYLVFINCSFGQTPEEDPTDSKIRIGFETGLGLNDIIDGVAFSEIPDRHFGLYFGAILKYVPNRSITGFNFGIRYQRISDWTKEGFRSRNSHFLLVPAELEFNILKNKKIRPFVKVGIALEISLDKEDPDDFIDRRQLSGSWRVGLGSAFAINAQSEIGFQIIRTGSPKAYRMLRYSPGGAPYTLDYDNSGLEFGLFYNKKLAN